jgi:peroxiredoxin Q/BCP
MAELYSGDRAPDFEAPTQSGDRVGLKELLARGPVVLFFYPKAMTPGCTKESCHFRDLASEFAEVGAHRIGISGDNVDLQSRFADKYDLDFPLLSDADGSIARAYGASRRGPFLNRRTTFVIGQDGILLDVIRSELNMNVHADKALELLRARSARQGGAAADTPRVVRRLEDGRRRERKPEDTRKRV